MPVPMVSMSRLPHRNDPRSADALCAGDPVYPRIISVFSLSKQGKNHFVEIGWSGIRYRCRLGIAAGLIARGW